MPGSLGTHDSSSVARYYSTTLPSFSQAPHFTLGPQPGFGTTHTKPSTWDVFETGPFLIQASKASSSVTPACQLLLSIGACASTGEPSCGFPQEGSPASMFNTWLHRRAADSRSMLG